MRILTLLITPLTATGTPFPRDIGMFYSSFRSVVAQIMILLLFLVVVAFLLALHDAIEEIRMRLLREGRRIVWQDPEYDRRKRRY